MPLTQETILAALRTVKYPGYSRDIVSFGIVKNIHAHPGHVEVSIELTSADPKISEALKPLVLEALKPFEKEAQIDVHLSVQEPAQKKVAAQIELPNIRKKIAIASGKGGVGKTTVAVNLAYALSLLPSEASITRAPSFVPIAKREGQAINSPQIHLGVSQAQPSKFLRVGLMDCDIYGPTVPLMLGATGEPIVEDGKLQPFVAHGLKVMSMGLLIDENAPVVWRGPMITKAIQQFITDVNWGTLDVLIVDLPPGTGDAQLTLAQTLKLDGALIVTTPQVAASQVAIRGAQMFAKVGVPILGVIENMSHYILPDGQKDFPFGVGGGEATSHALNAPLWAQLPIDSLLREHADAGRPLLSVEEMKNTVSANIYRELAERIISPP